MSKKVLKVKLKGKSFLGNLPLVGWLFKSETNSRQEKYS